MTSSETRSFLSIGLVVLVFTIGMASGAPAFADQESSPKVECKVDSEVTDHNKNTVVGPIDLQCNSTSSNIKDSTIIEAPPSNGDSGSPYSGEHGSK